MKLFFSQTSPYVRKVRLAAHHLGLTDRLELVTAVVTPLAEDAAVASVAPLSKIPALVLDDGSVLFDSRVIVEYLDHLAGGGRLLPPPSDPERWASLRLQATADGLQDAALLGRYEVALRPEPLRWPEWSAGQGRKVSRAIAALEADLPRLKDGAPLNAMCAASALGYADFRFPELGWRTQHPALGDFFDAYAKRPEMVWTHPTFTG
jgi:glutathione S-transferase